jgi:rSAM/selenodomain-associated transferase 2
MISIIVPVLNEARNIERLLQHLSANAKYPHLLEIIVVDGGSTDGTQAKVAEISKRLTSVSVQGIVAEKGRAVQMNAGAKYAKGTILYFLHADSLPPKNFDALIQQEVSQGNPAGCFRMQFDSSHLWLQLAGWLTQFKWRACRGGDQSQFITSQLFWDIGGYDETYTIYEDNILINELYARRKFVVINKKLLTSARLYREKGVFKLQYHFWAIYVKKWLGADANELYAYYKKHVRPRPSSATTDTVKYETQRQQL